MWIIAKRKTVVKRAERGGLRMSARFLYACLIAAALAAAGYAGDKEIKWEKDFESAMQRAKETGRPVFADFTSTVN